MSSRSRTHMPRRLDKIWVEGQPQPNGYVLLVDHDMAEVLVRFYDDKTRGVEAKVKTFALDDFYSNFSHSFGGIWMMHS